MEWTVPFPHHWRIARLSVYGILSAPFAGPDDSQVLVGKFSLPRAFGNNNDLSFSLGMPSRRQRSSLGGTNLNINGSKFGGSSSSGGGPHHQQIYHSEQHDQHLHQRLLYSSAPAPSRGSFGGMPARSSYDRTDRDALDRLQERGLRLGGSPDGTSTGGSRIGSEPEPLGTGSGTTGC